MWKHYSLSYIKNNRSTSISVMVSVFIAALFLSLLSSLFYNFWIYDIEKIQLEEGPWQGRIAGDIDAGMLETIKAYANVKSAIVNEELSGSQETVVDICFENLTTILTDMPRIAKLTGLSQDAVSYHHNLLSMYLIRDPQDTAPRLIFPFVLFITIISCLSLVMIIHNSFAVSMDGRIHQFGIFSSIGATPKQIRTCLLQEAAILGLIPLAAGMMCGIASGMWVIRQINSLVSEVAGRHDAIWRYHPLVFLFTLMVTVLTIFISAWIPARKMSRLTPLETIKNTGELQLNRKKTSPILAFFFGVEGELAGNALKAQRKALRTTTLSLILSFLAFTLMQCFLTLFGISQRMTYFNKYQDVWDVMVTVLDADITSFNKTGEIQALSGVESGVVYQKAMAKRLVTPDEISADMAAFGGFSHASTTYVTETDDGWLVNAPIVILDDASFLAYCEQANIPPQLDGAVIRNQIEDAKNPNFRSRESYDYIGKQKDTSELLKSESPDGVIYSNEKTAAEIPVLAYTREVPALREDYGTLDLYELVHFMPVSLWNEIKGQIGDAKEDLYIRVLAKEATDAGNLSILQKEIQTLLGSDYELLSENRIQDKINNDNMFYGIKMIISGFCILLAMIGIGNVFSNTLGFVRQRKREFARYLSIGLEPEGLGRIFFIEALVIAGRPVLITLPLSVFSVWFMIKFSYLEPMVFIREVPLLPILVFLLAIAGFVALAYYLGWKKVAGISLTDALRDDTIL